MVEEILSGGGVRLVRNHVMVSDGVALNLYDFSPDKGSQDAPAVVFVPGWVSLISGWIDVLKVLTPRMRVIYLETREKYSACIPKGPLPEFTLERMRKDLEEVLLQVLPGDTPFVLAGSSLGSTIILEYLNRGNGRIPEKSILVSPISQVDFPFWARMLIRFFPPAAYSLIKHAIIFYLTRFKVDKHKEPEQAEKYKGTLLAAEPYRLKANAQALSGYSVWNRLGHVTSEVVLVGARTDKLHGLGDLEKMVEGLPMARLEVMGSNLETHSEKLAYVLLEELEPDRIKTWGRRGGC
ncbi:MAG: alpha/beta hydrolase [Proteobacteria bacterium]|nr:alpha/beta hydrolase [Pseudomonadota bacterium]